MLNANCQIIKYIYIDVVFSSMVFAHAVKFVSATVDSRLKLSNSCFLLCVRAQLAAKKCGDLS